MASNTIFLSGIAKWAKFYKPDEKYNNYKVDLALDPQSLETFKKTNLMLTLKDTEEGPTITLRRPISKLIKGELVNFGPPEVIDSNNDDVDLEKVSIGNGSKITCRVVVYDTMKGKGHRLEKVRIDELVSYEGPSESDMPF